MAQKNKFYPAGGAYCGRSTLRRPAALSILKVFRQVIQLALGGFYFGAGGGVFSYAAYVFKG